MIKLYKIKSPVWIEYLDEKPRDDYNWPGRDSGYTIEEGYFCTREELKEAFNTGFNFALLENTPSFDDWLARKEAQQGD